MGIDPGVYFILNIDDEGLAVQYHGNNTRLLVDKKQNTPSHKWIVSGDHSDHTKPQSITPLSAQNLQCNPIANFVEPVGAPYSWYIFENDGVCIVQDENQLYVWCLDGMQTGGHVVLRNAEEAAHESWVFIKVK